MSLYSENLLYENLRYCIDISIYNIFERDLYRCLYTVGVKLREKDILLYGRERKKGEEKEIGEEYFARWKESKTSCRNTNQLTSEHSKYNNNGREFAL